MDALEKLILDGKFQEFTMQDVADVAGVSHPTVYRHFPSREALLENYVQWAEQRTREIHPPHPERLEDLPDWVEEAVPLVMPYLPIARAIEPLIAAVYRKDIPRASRDRDELVAKYVAQVAPGLSAAHQKAITAELRLLVSVRTWVELHTRYGLNEEELTLAVTEGIQAQISRLKVHAAEERKG